MANILITPPSGWNKWIYASTTFSVDGQIINLPDAGFPVIYTPASAFWMRSLIDHCNISWINVVDPFTAFALSGGTTSVVGATAGLTAMAGLNDLYNAAGSFGLFPRGKGGPGPILGYCIGTEFKQQIYVRFAVLNSYGTVETLGSAIELRENSRFKRIYLYEGEVVDYVVIGDEHLLRLDIDKISPPSNQSIAGNITIIKANGSSLKLTFTGIKNNWDFIINTPTNVFPESGDYYVFEQPLIIEDPSLLSVFLYGPENQVEGRISSGLNLFVSDKNSPYEDGKFLGTYLWQKTPPTSDVIGTEEVTESSVTELPVTEEIAYFQPSFGSNMRDSDGYTWAFLGYGNSDKSETYNNDVRYKETLLIEPDSANNNSISRYQARLVASNNEYEKAINSKDIEYLRVEISSGGYYTRNNWHAPALKGSYIEVNGFLFKILDHIEFNIIDVSIKSIDGEALFNPTSNQNYSIVNQYAWMINENYMQNISDFSISGVFEGNVISISDKKIGVEVKGDPLVLTGEKYNYSLIDRYKNGVDIPSSFGIAFKRFQDWRLIANNTEYIVDDVVNPAIDFQDPEVAGGPYVISINLRDVPIGLQVGDSTYVSFDKPYETVNNFTKKGLGIDLSISASFSGEAGSAFVVSNSLCLDGDFMSAPYSFSIPLNTRFGICDGYLFGISSNGSASLRGAQTSFLTTPRSARGIASLYHVMRQEDWAFYEDPISGKITSRRGSDNFSEYPMKSLIVIGKPDFSESAGGGTEILLNQTRDYLRRIRITPPNNDGSDSPALLFGIGNPNNIYGFFVSGDGIVDLGMLRKQGLSAGDTAIGGWTNDGINVSPVYVYKKDYYSQIDTKNVDIGIPTDAGPIYIQNGVVENVIAQYVKENQILSTVGYFDAIRKRDGEILLIYGQEADEFTINNNLNNSSGSYKNAVFIIGTYDDDFTWAAPTTYDVGDDKNVENQYSLMVMNGVDFLSSVYNPMSETISIFCRCFQNGSPYIGCLIIPTYNLFYKPLIKLCAPVSETSRPFLWRHPTISDLIISDQNQFWTDDVINDGLSYPKCSVPDDVFVRVMGPEATNSYVHNINEVGIISTNILPDGTYALFYDSEGGIKTLFSYDGGYSWVESGILWATNGRAGIMVDHYFLYISSSGITSVQTDYAHFYIARDLAAGISTPGNEKDLQDSIDSLDRTLIGSGAIDFQRLSGYVSPNGTVKIFFYDQNQLLKCIESKSSTFEWTVANNF